MRRMAQQYYECVNYKEEHVQEQKKLPKGACHSYIIVFQSVFNIIFNVSLSLINDFINIILFAGQTGKPFSFLLHQLSFVFAEFPMAFVLNSVYLHDNSHILDQVKHCGKDTCLLTSSSDSLQIHHKKLGTIKVQFTSMLILRGRVWEIGMFIN